MSNLTNSTIYTFLTQIPTQILGIIAGIFITRILGPEGRGIYAIFLADIGLFTTILGFSINSTITQFIASKRIDEGKIIGISVVLSILSVVLSIVFLALWINSPISHVLIPDEHLSLSLILIFIIYLCLTQVTNVYLGFFQGARRFDIVNRVSLINSVLNVTLFASAYLLNQYTSIRLGLSEILLISICVFAFNVGQWHFHFIKIRVERATFKIKWRQEIMPFLRFTGIGHLSQIVNFFNYRMVLWIIAYYLNEYQLGIFALAAGLSQLFGFISTPLSQVLTPYLSSEREDERNRTFISFSRLHFSLITLLAAISILIAPYLIAPLYGQEFNASVTPYYLLLFGTIASGQTRIFASLMMANYKLQYTLYASLIGFCATFISNIYFVKWWGINGAAIAQSVTYLSIFISVYIAILTKTSVQSSNLLFPSKMDLIKIRSKLTRKL